MWPKSALQFGLLIMALVLTAGCTPQALHLNLSTSSSLSSQGNGDQKIILQQYCTSCHSGQHDLWKAFASDADWQRAGLIVAGSPETSPLVARLKYSSGTSANMPGDAFLFSQFTLAESKL